MGIIPLKSKVLLPLAIAIAVALTATILQLSFNSALGAGEVASITAADPTTITEGTDATFTVTLNDAAPTGGLMISVTVTDSGSYITDTDSVPTEVVIAAGATSATLTVSTEDDSMDEPDGSITAEITMPDGAGYTVADAPANAAVVFVLDNDDPVASISADPTPIAEGTATTFTVTLGSAAPAGGLTISVDVTESGSYIADSAPTEVVIAAGATSCDADRLNRR